MTPEWLNDTVRAFGRQLGLGSFALNDRGSGGVRFENGVSLMFEYAADSLFVSVRVKAEPTVENLKMLLGEAHPSARTGLRQTVRAAYLEKAGEAMYVVRLGAREASVPALEDVFRALWAMAARLGRAVA